MFAIRKAFEQTLAPRESDSLSEVEGEPSGEYKSRSLRLVALAQHRSRARRTTEEKRVGWC